MFNNKISPYILVAVIIAINTFFWSKINLPYVNSEDVRGIYSLNNYSSQNDTLRFLIYIFLPLIFYFIYNFFIQYKKKNIFKKIFKNKTNR